MSRRDVGWVLPALVGFGAILFFVAWRNWLAGDELYFAVLAMLSAGVFAAAFFVSDRQIAAEARKDLIKARDEILALKGKVTELQAALKKAQDAQAVTAQSLTSAATDTAGSLENIGTRLELAVNANRAADATSAATETANTLQTVAIDKALDSAAGVIEKLPEGHRLAGWWVAAAVFLALLAFAVPADIDISTSDSNAPAAEAGENAKDDQNGEDGDDDRDDDDNNNETETP